MKRRCLAAAIVTATFGVDISAAIAQAPATERRALEEVMVSARRMEESLQEIPVSVVAVSADDLQDMGIDNLETLSAFVPNLAAGTAMGNNGWASFSIRGIGGGQGWIYQESGVGIYIDDIYYPRANGALLDVIDVQHIEVLRGPQGTLFGRNTTGGAIRYVTAKPDQEFSGRMVGAVGSYDRRDISGHVNIPLTEQLAARVTIASKQRDGFVKNLTTGIKSGNVDVQAARGQLRWQNDKIDWNFAMDALETSNDGAARDVPLVDGTDAWPSGMPPGVPGNNPDFNMSLVTPDPFTVLGGPVQDWAKLKSRGITNTIEFDLSENWTFKSLTGWRDGDSQSLSDWDLTPIKVYDIYVDVEFSNWSQEFQLNGKLWNDRLDLVLGAFYMDEEAEYVDITASDTSPIMNRSKGYEIETQSIAAFAQGSLSITDDLRATLGVRWSEDDKKLATTQDVVPPATVVSDSDSWSSVTYRAGLDYKITPDVMVYASVAEGFKAGGLNNSAANINYLRPYDPEEVTTYEVGIRAEFWDNRARVNATYFFNDYTDIQVAQMIWVGGRATQVTNNAASAEVEGVELEGLLQLTDNLQLRASAGWTDAKYKKLDEGVGVELDTPFQRTPEYSYTVGARYTQPLASGASLDFNIDYGWQDKQYNNNSASNGFWLDSYGLLNAKLAYHEPNGRWSIALVGTNLLDEEYLIGGFDGSTRDNIIGAIHHDYGRPREVGVELTVEF